MILPRYTLERVYLPKSTPGSLFQGGIRIEDKIICKTLELPWRNNAMSVSPDVASCIPEGIYLVKLWPAKESRPYPYFRIDFVPGRNWEQAYKASNILIHPANYAYQLLGCISPGSRHADLNADGIVDISDSTKKMKWLTDNLPPVFELEIRKKLGA